MPTKREYYKPGSWWRISDRTGFKVRAEQTRKEWTGMILEERVFEPRNQQDFVRGVKDQQAAPEPRDRQTDVFIGPIYLTLTADALPQATALSVNTITGVKNGDKLGIMLLDGTLFLTTVSGAPSGLTVNIAKALPMKAPSGNLVTDYNG